MISLKRVYSVSTVWIVALPILFTLLFASPDRARAPPQS